MPSPYGSRLLPLAARDANAPGHDDQSWQALLAETLEESDPRTRGTPFADKAQPAATDVGVAHTTSQKPADSPPAIWKKANSACLRRVAGLACC